MKKASSKTFRSDCIRPVGTRKPMLAPQGKAHCGPLRPRRRRAGDGWGRRPQGVPLPAPLCTLTHYSRPTPDTRLESRLERLSNHNRPNFVDVTSWTETIRSRLDCLVLTRHDLFRPTWILISLKILKKSHDLSGSALHLNQSGHQRK